MAESPDNDSRSQTAAWLVWVIPQLGVLALLAARIPFSAGFPKPVEDAAPIAIVVTQLILAISLAPRLFLTWQDVAAVSGTAIPIATLATLHGGRSSVANIASLVLVLLWFGALRALNRVPGSATQIVIRTILLLLAVGGPILWYLEIEYGDDRMILLRILSAVSPTQGAITTGLHPRNFWWISAFPAAIVVGSALLSIKSKAKPLPKSLL